MNDLRMLDCNELYAGQVLPGHLRDRNGRILMQAGQALDEASLRRLNSGRSGTLFVGPDWDTAATFTPTEEGLDPKRVVTPNELMQVLKRRGTARGGGERGRRHPRHSWRVRLKLVLRETGADEPREVLVTTSDLSASGIAFVCNRFIHPGTLLFAQIETLPQRPVIKAIVRHCRYITGREHRVGAEFLEVGVGAPRAD